MKRLVKRLLLTVAAALCVIAGSVLTRFSNEVVPTAFLARPLVIATLVAVVVGLLSMNAGRYAPLAAVAGAVVVVVPNWWTFAGYLVVMAAAGLVEHRGWTVDPAMPTLVAAGVFAAVGLAGAMPHISVSSADMPEPIDGRPVFLLMLDGYPRPDVLHEMGMDVSSFVQAMENRGFEHYPDARSRSYNTHWVLASMLGAEEGDGGWGTVAERRRVRNTLELPRDFVTVSPGVGHVTIDQGVDIGPGGVNDFEFDLVRRSVFGHLPWVGDLMLDLWRQRLDESLDAVADAEHGRVFAHIMAPHAPYTYGPDGPLSTPACWPECSAFWAYPVNHIGLESTVQWLNARLLETVDRILSSRPDAVIVLFGDHGLRFDGGVEENNYKPILLARTPKSPGLFSDAPRPDEVFDRVRYDEGS